MQAMAVGSTISFVCVRLHYVGSVCTRCVTGDVRGHLWTEVDLLKVELCEHTVDVCVIDAHGCRR
jgi:hypothetical protein